MFPELKSPRAFPMRSFKPKRAARVGCKVLMFLRSHFVRRPLGLSRGRLSSASQTNFVFSPSGWFKFALPANRCFKFSHCGEFGDINNGRFLQSSRQCFASYRGKLIGEVTGFPLTNRWIRFGLIAQMLSLSRAIRPGWVLGIPLCRCLPGPTTFFYSGIETLQGDPPGGFTTTAGMF